MQISLTYSEILKKNELFWNIDENNMQEVLSYLNANIKKYTKNETIIRLGDQMIPGIIMKGKVKITYYDESYSEMPIAYLKKEDYFGFGVIQNAGFSSPFELIALSDVEIVFFDLKPLITKKYNSNLPTYHFILLANLLPLIVRMSRFLSMRIRMLGQKSIRNRIIFYLSYLSKNQAGGGNELTLPFSMTEFAAFINSNRTAIYKEINLLKKENYLDWNGRKVILKKDMVSL